MSDILNRTVNLRAFSRADQPLGLPGRAWDQFRACVALLISGAAAIGQDSGSDVTKMNPVVVAGSNIPTPEVAAEAGFSPLVIIDRPRIDATGLQTLGEVLQSMTISNDGAVPLSNNAAGTAISASSTSIHGLGPDATLVLIDGHRVANFPEGDEGTVAFVDLNTIPLFAVDRVEVLKDGASAIYGADAVAGVVNIVLRKNFEGSLLFVRYGNTTDLDSSELSTGMLVGAGGSWGNVTVSANYYHRNAIYDRDRSYSLEPPALSQNSSPISAQITQQAYDEALNLPPGTPPPGVSPAKSVFYATPGITPGAPGGNTISPNGLPVAGSTNLGNTPPGEYLYSTSRISIFDPNLFESSLPESTRYGVLAAAEVRVPHWPNARFYFDSSLQHDSTNNQLAAAATGSFTQAGDVELVIPARTPNPLPLPDGRARAAVPGAYNPFNPFNIDLTGGSHFRLEDFGNRVLVDLNEAILGTIGLRVDNFAGTWNLDTGYRYSQISDDSRYRMVSISRFNRILNQADPIFDPASPDYIGAQTAYNPFGYYLNPIASNRPDLNYATVNVHDHNLSTLWNGFLSLNNPSLFRLPAGAVGIAAGLDFRQETLEQVPDPYEVEGDILGSSEATPTNNSRGVAAVYAEARLPLTSPAQGLPGLYRLAIDLAARSETFLSNSQTRVLPRLGLLWQPFGDTVLLRASIGQGIRQPSIYELFMGTSTSTLTIGDPRDGSTYDVTAVVKSNRELRSERTQSGSAGVVWTPEHFLQGLTVSLDAWRIARNGTVTVEPQNTVDRYFGAAPGGQIEGEEVLLDNTGAISEVVSTFFNSGETVAKGFDLVASYGRKDTGWGSLLLEADASYLESFRIADLPGDPAFEFAGYDDENGDGNDAYLRRKLRLEGTWAHRGVRANLTASYTDGFIDYDPDGNPYRVASVWSFDARLSYRFNLLRHDRTRATTISVGANNAFDRSPPTVVNPANFTGYPGFIYTAVGRFLYASVEQRY